MAWMAAQRREKDQELEIQSGGMGCSLIVSCGGFWEQAASWRGVDGRQDVWLVMGWRRSRRSSLAGLQAERAGGEGWRGRQGGSGWNAGRACGGAGGQGDDAEGSEGSLGEAEKRPRRGR